MSYFCTPGVYDEAEHTVWEGDLEEGDPLDD